MVKNNIYSYFNGLGSGSNGVSVYYDYNHSNKTISRTERTDVMVTSYMTKKIDEVVFEYTESEFSDEFNKEEDLARGFYVSEGGVTVVPKNARLG